MRARSLLAAQSLSSGPRPPATCMGSANYSWEEGSPSLLGNVSEVPPDPAQEGCSSDPLAARGRYAASALGSAPLRCARGLAWWRPVPPLRAHPPRLVCHVHRERGSAPGSIAALSLQPVIWEHQLDSALNVSSGGTIQLNYSVTIQSGG
jgi:hypothetical protein